MSIKNTSFQFRSQCYREITKISTQNSTLRTTIDKDKGKIQIFSDKGCENLSCTDYLFNAQIGYVQEYAPITTNGTQAHIRSKNPVLVHVKDLCWLKNPSKLRRQSSKLYETKSEYYLLFGIKHLCKHLLIPQNLESTREIF